MAKRPNLDELEATVTEYRALHAQIARMSASDDPLVLLVRGVVLIERALMFMLEDYLVEGLKPFENRTTMAFLTDLAFSVGLLSTNERSVVHAVRELRNKVAHRVDVTVSDKDELELADVFRANGFSLDVQSLEKISATFAPALDKKEGKVYDWARPFATLRHMLVFLVVLLNARNAQRDVFKLPEYAEDRAGIRDPVTHLVTLFFNTGYLDTGTEEQREEHYRKLAQGELKIREQRRERSRLRAPAEKPKAKGLLGTLFGSMFGANDQSQTPPNRALNPGQVPPPKPPTLPE